MRRALLHSLFTLVILTALIGPSLWTGSAQAQTGPYVTASTAVNVRGGPGTGFWILGALYPGEIVPVLGVSPDAGWWYVNAPFGQGWVAAIGVAATNTAGVTVSDPGPIGTVQSSTLHVRYGAGPNAASLGVLGQGQQVYVLAQNADGSWYQVRWAYGTGWVAGDYLAITGAGAIRTDSGQGGGGVVVSGDTPYVIVNATYLNVRTGPGINYTVLGQVYGGNELPIVGRTNDSTWYQVTTPYGSGWVYAAMVVARNEYGASPVTSSTAANAEVSGPYGIINTGALNLRSGPGSQYTSLGALAGGTETRIVGRTLDWTWWLLDTPIGTGWANAIYILVRGDTSGVPYVPAGGTAEPEPGYAGGEAPSPVVAGPVAFVNTGALNIRSGPNNTFTSLGSVYAGTRMPIIGQSPDGGWWLVQSPFGNGWVTKLLVLVEGSTAGIPVK